MFHYLEFSYGQVKKFCINVIAKSMFTRACSDVFTVTLFEVVTDYEKDDFAVEMSDKDAMNSKEIKMLQNITQGWKLKFHWNDGSDA